MKKNNEQTDLSVLFGKYFFGMKFWKTQRARFLLVKHSKDARIFSPIKFNTANNMALNDIDNSQK